MRDAARFPTLANVMSNRTLTVLFTDIVGSTELLEGLTPRDAERWRRTHFRTLHDNVERSGGRVLKNLGDGVMATFESARDGIEAAVALECATVHGLRAGSADPASIRVGLSSGDVHIEDGDCFGPPVIEACRLCAEAGGGQILLAESTRLLAGSHQSLAAVGDLLLKGLATPVTAWEALWSSTAPTRLRVLLADDAVLVREGIARVLEERGIEVLGQAGDAGELLRLTAELRPDLAIVDIRMPPTHTAEGLEAAESLLADHPHTGVLILSQDLEPRYAARLLAARPAGVGYLLKERVTDVAHFADAASQVARGGKVFEPALLRGAGADLAEITKE
jgi:class 3 adenylate cyclase/CheY-like chemotaxis protein